MEDERDTTSRRQKFKRSSMTHLSCCFHRRRYEELHSPEPETKWRGGHRRRRHSYDFSYDPMSYALNFDQGPPVEVARDDEIPESSFSRRLRNSTARRNVEHGRPIGEAMGNLVTRGDMPTNVEPVTAPRARNVTPPLPPPPPAVSQEIFPPPLSKPLVETF